MLLLETDCIFMNVPQSTCMVFAVISSHQDFLEKIIDKLDVKGHIRCP